MCTWAFAPEFVEHEQVLLLANDPVIATPGLLHHKLPLLQLVCCWEGHTIGSLQQLWVCVDQAWCVGQMVCLWFGEQMCCICTTALAAG